MGVKSIMTKRVVTVHMDDTVETIRHVFEKTRFHHVIVLHDDKVEGIISDRDVLKAVSPFIDTYGERRKDRMTLDRKAHQIMTRDIIALKPTDTIVTAIQLFNRYPISCLPVINSKRQIEGIVSWRDIMKHVEALVERKKSQSE